MQNSYIAKQLKLKQPKQQNSLNSNIAKQLKLKQPKQPYGKIAKIGKIAIQIAEIDMAKIAKQPYSKVAEIAIGAVHKVRQQF